jgi:hypothetical protein
LGEGLVVTRLGRILPGKQVDLAQAFRFLGVAPSYRELGLVVNWLRESGVEEVIYDEESVELAKANGSGALVALDLSVAFAHGVESLYAGPRAGRPVKAER